jgi:hypothetical protein
MKKCSIPMFLPKAHSHYMDSARAWDAGMGAADSRSLRSDNYVRIQHFVRRTTYTPFGVFGGMCDVNSCNILLLLFMTL